MRPTIHTVAERAGVSTATVSRFLNGSTRVSEETAAKVQCAIDELDYVPNASARGLAMNTTGTLALIFPKLSGPFFSEVIRGAEIGARETGYHLLIYGASSGTTPNRNQTLELLATKADGLILASELISTTHIQSLQRRRVAVVVLGGKPEGISVDSVRPDDFGGAVKAIDHLIEHGYRRIAMISGPITRRHTDDRRMGYQTALHTHGLPCYPELMTAGAFDEESGYAAMRRLLQHKPGPDAVFAANDQMAIGAMAAVRESGLRVPDDIAMIGFDDIEPARYVQPALTTVHQDMLGQSQYAVRLLVSRIDRSEGEIETKVMPTHLIIRRSCGCPMSSSSSEPIG